MIPVDLTIDYRGARIYNLCFNLSTPQTKVEHLDGLCHWEMGLKQ